MPDLLIEFGCEELPSSACREILEQASGLATQALTAARLPDGAVTVWVAPRRFAIHIAGLPETREGRAVSHRGPAEQAAFGPDGAPTKAAEGFARSQGLTAADLVVREDQGRNFVYADRDEPAVAVSDLVPGVAAAILDGIRLGKTMRWGDGTGLRFSRPVRWIVAKLGDKTVPFTLHDLVAGDVSQGHRFLGAPTAIASASSYRDDLRAQGVVADQAERRAEIVAGLDAAATAEGCAWSDPGGKLAEVLFLVERPSVIVGDINPDHLRLPERVLVTAMQSHQRYFPLTTPDGALHPRFLAVSNGDPAHAAVITRGNAGVLEARLQDAAFSFDRDLEAGLDALDARLDSIVFHKRLGSMAQKRDRLTNIAELIALKAGLDATTATTAARAAQLSKVDQGAVLVAEFAELQGEVAGDYAELWGESTDVAQAIREHYLPQGPGSPLPTSGAGQVVALAEKIDSLTGAFYVNEIPTGSKDPYGLRRAAAGLTRILLETGWEIDPQTLFSATADDLRTSGADLILDDETALPHLKSFLADRLAFHLSEEGVDAESVAAAQGADVGGVVATARWAKGIAAARDTEGLKTAGTASTRLVRLAAKGPDGGAFVSAADADEDALHHAITVAGPLVEAAREHADVEVALADLVPLVSAVDRFFVDVMVNSDNEAARARRYALVREARDVFLRVADFTKLTDGSAR